MNGQIKSSPRDVLMHIFSIILLYVSVGSFIALTFQFVNAAFPDPLNPHYDAGNTIRWSLAILIIIFPIFLWAARFLERDMARTPEKADLKIRKWLLYFTLFAAAGFIIGDLVTLIFNFLEGDLTTRFLLKILIVLLVAAGVFGYYLNNLRKKPGEFSSRMKMFVWAVIVLVGISIIYGFFVAGSPFKQRLVRFDSQKVSHLSEIQYQVINYWQNKNKLPDSLQDLVNDISGYRPPVDPQTKESYKYRTTGNLAFELCANFNLTSEESNLGGRNYPKYGYPYPIDGQSDNWDHGIGEKCFARTIDPEIYRPFEKVPAVR